MGEGWAGTKSENHHLKGKTEMPKEEPETQNESVCHHHHMPGEIKCGMPILLLAGLAGLLKELPEEERKIEVEKWKQYFAEMKKEKTDA